MSQLQVSADLAEKVPLSHSEMLGRLEQLTEAVQARDTFIAVAAHELRNPLMPIMGQIDLLLSAIRSGKCTPELMDGKLVRLQQTVQHFVKRAVVLLDVSRLNSGGFRLEPIPCDFASLLRQIAEDFGAAAQHSGVTLTVIAPECVPGLWDRLAVEQIIDNLVSNAIKYGGRSPVELTLSQSAQNVLVQVRDHGKGIAPEDRARVLQRFERAVGHNEHRSGFGVGLWVVGQLVQAMRGSINIDDAPGGGALFTVSLPYCRAEG
jgi:two-component system OmpR family sensor kinase